MDPRLSHRTENNRELTWTFILLLELIPGGAKEDLSAAQAKTLLAGVRPRDVVGKTRRVAAELISDLERIYARKKAANNELTHLLDATGAGLTNLQASNPKALPGCWSKSATSPGPPTATTSPPGTAPHLSTPPFATESATGAHAKAIASSTTSGTSWPPSSSGTPPRAAPTTTDAKPRGRLDGSNAGVETAAVEHRLQDHARRRIQTRGIGRGEGSGRATG